MSPSTGPQSAHSYADDALGRDDATALAERVRKRDVSPSELVEAAIERARRVEPFINGIVTDSFHEARNVAQRFGKDDDSSGRGFFSGIPTFIKDNTDVAGLPTMHGSKAVPRNIARHTSPYALQMLNQGYICLGKSTLPEFGFNATGAPAIALPTALTSDNLPVSIQLMGQYGDERTLLELAFALEAESP